MYMYVYTYFTKGHAELDTTYVLRTYAGVAAIWITSWGAVSIQVKIVYTV